MAKNWNVSNGFLACDFNGEKIGAVRDVSGENHFRVDTWYLGLDKELYIPFDAVTRVGGSKIYVNAPKDRIEHTGWDRKPEELAA